MNLEEVKNHIKNTPISAIIGLDIPLQKKGSNYEAICPFHSDTKPSLKVNDSKQIFKCFACDAAGDSISYFQKKYQFDFVEAIKAIAKLLSLPLDELEKKADPEIEFALRVLKSCNRLFMKTAQELNPKDYKKFLDNRNLNFQSANDFQIGFAPANNAYFTYLKSLPKKDREKAINMALKIGVIGQGKNGYYDTYRNRIMFPIWDHNGRVRGFSGRAVENDQKPKYMNSKESLVFHKKTILYGYHLAKKSIRDQDAVIITEGYMDCIALHQAGFTNTVAIMGVALSDQGIKNLSALTKNFILAMDSDDAGLKASQRINDDLLNYGIMAKFLNFKPCKDPDEFIAEHGKISFQKLMDEAPLFVDQQIADLIAKGQQASTDQKLELFKDACRLLSPLKSDLKATERIVNFSKSLGLRSTPEALLASYQSICNDKQKQLATSIKKVEIAEIFDQPELPNSLKQDNLQNINKAERILLRESVLNPSLFEKANFLEILDFVENSEVKEILGWIYKLYHEVDEGEFITILKSSISGREIHLQIKEALYEALFHRLPNSEKTSSRIIDKIYQDLQARLQYQNLLHRKSQLKQRQAQNLTEQESHQLMNEIMTIERKISELKKETTL